MAKLTLANCQFHIDKCLNPNRGAVIRQMMKRAQADNVHLDHFSEACPCLEDCQEGHTGA